ncbi:MAG: DNA gyrase subunit A [Oscillospiraceae bacterium]
MYTEGSKVINVDIESEMQKSFLEYSMSVIVARALPDVRDGLKPVHRRILYTMHEAGLTPDKKYLKCAATVGDVLGKYHPHGDASVYDALVRLAQDFSMRYPLVDGHGNFGSVDGDPAAAYRYTEAKMAKISQCLLTDIDKETVSYIPNYDDRLQEPTVLPSRYPNLLVNGSTGIAVGMATNIPPHNLREVIEGVNTVIDNPEATLDEIMEHIKGPDFPTGGIIMGRSGIRAAYSTGRGKITLRGKVSIEEHKNNREKIVVTEIPYMVNKARLIENMANLVKDKRIDQISDLRDESDRDGMRIVIELKRDANAQVVLNQLYRYTQLQDTVGVIQIALVNGEPKVLTLKQMIEEYIKFQEVIIRKRTEFDLRKVKAREHILEGLKIAIDNMDEVIKILRAASDVPKGKQALIDRFGLSDLQSQAIVQMRFGQLTGLETLKIEEELSQILATVEELESILADEHKILEIIKKELNEIKEKFGDERRTDIQVVSGEVDIEDLIPVEDCVITLTHYGYIKRQAMDTYKTQRRGGRGISGMQRRDEDFVQELFVCSTHDYVMFFTSRGRVFRLKGYEIAESSRNSKGTNIVNLLQLETDEKITSVIKVDEFDDERYLVMITRQGIIKRTELSAYSNVRKSGLISINLDEGDELAWVKLTNGKSDVIVATKKGMAIRFDENDARPLGRTARGVKAINLDEDDIVVGMAVPRENATLLTVSESGLGRRTELEEYRPQSRAGKGSINYKIAKNGLVAGIAIVEEDDDVIMISDDGIIIRIHSNEIASQSRYGGGVRVMRINGEGRVVTLAATPREEESDIPISEVEVNTELDENGGEIMEVMSEDIEDVEEMNDMVEIDDISTEE